MAEPPSRRIDDLLDVFPSFALLAGMRLELFSALDAAPLDLEELAAAIAVEPRRLRPLVYALVAAGLLQRQQTAGADLFANGEEAADRLVRGRPGYIGGNHPLLAQLWEGGLRAADSVRRGRPQAAHDFSAMPAPQRETFFAGLHPEALETGRQLGARPEWAACRRLVDVGGGSGGVSIALAQRYPLLEGTVTELPAVLPLTRRYIADAGLGGRLHAVSAETQTAGPYDAAILKSYLQILGPQEAAQALADVAATVRPGGTIFVLGAGIITDDRLQPADAALFNLVFPSFYPDGQAYTLSEHRAWFEAAGCILAEAERLGGQFLLVGRRR